MSFLRPKMTKNSPRHRNKLGHNHNFNKKSPSFLKTSRLLGAKYVNNLSISRKLRYSKPLTKLNQTKTRNYRYTWKRHFTVPSYRFAGNSLKRMRLPSYALDAVSKTKLCFFSFSKNKLILQKYLSLGSYTNVGTLWREEMLKKPFGPKLETFNTGFILSQSSKFLFKTKIASALSLTLPNLIRNNLLPNDHYVIKHLTSPIIAQPLPNNVLFLSFYLYNPITLLESHKNYSNLQSIYLDNSIKTLQLQRSLAFVNISLKAETKRYFRFYSYSIPSSVFIKKSPRTFIPELKLATKGFYSTVPKVTLTDTSLTTTAAYPSLVPGPLRYPARVTSSGTPYLKSKVSHQKSLLNSKKYVAQSSHINKNLKLLYKNLFAHRAVFSKFSIYGSSISPLTKSNRPIKPKLLLTRLRRGNKFFQRWFKRFKFRLRRKVRRKKKLSRKIVRFSLRLISKSRRKYRSFLSKPRIKNLLRRKIRRLRPTHFSKTNKMSKLETPKYFKDKIVSYKKIKTLTRALTSNIAAQTLRCLTSISASPLHSPSRTDNLTSISSTPNLTLRNTLVDLITTRSLFSIWSQPILMKALTLNYSKYLQNTHTSEIPHTNSKWGLRVQNQALSYLFGPKLSSLRKVNLWLVPTTNYVIRRKLLRMTSNRIFTADVSTWYYASLTRFIENCTGQKTALNFGPFIEGALTFEDKAKLSLWGLRVNGFQKMLGHRIFVHEALMLVALSLKLKDPTFLANWIRGMLKRMSFWKYRLLFRYLKFLIRYIFGPRFSEFNFRGFKLRLKGKISVAGNARTRTLVLRVGNTSHSKMDNKVAYDLSYVNTFTGVLGFKLWFFY